MLDHLTVTVVFCAPGVEDITQLRLPPASTVSDAIAAARLRDRWPQLQNATDVGIWGRRCSLDQRLADGDRLEVYRPLTIDPKEARRQRAQLANSSKAGNKPARKAAKT